jgi:hypothetical protein
VGICSVVGSLSNFPGPKVRIWHFVPFLTLFDSKKMNVSEEVSPKHKQFQEVWVFGQFKRFNLRRKFMIPFVLFLEL